MTNTFLRLPKVIKITGLSRSTIFLRISEGKFPKQIKLGSRSVAWIESEVSDWIQSRIDDSRKGGDA